MASSYKGEVDQEDASSHYMGQSEYSNIVGGVAAGGIPTLDTGKSRRMAAGNRSSMQTEKPPILDRFGNQSKQ